MTSHTDIENKLMTPKEAVRKFIKDGAQVAIGGFTINRNPMGIVYEIIRQRKRKLHLVCHSNGQALDLLIGAGCVTKVEIAYGGNGRFAPTCIRFRKAIENGEIAFALADDFINDSHGIPIYGKSADGKLSPVFDEFSHGFLRCHQLVLKVRMSCHPAFLGSVALKSTTCNPILYQFFRRFQLFRQ